MDPPTAPKFGSFPRRRKVIESAEEPAVRSNARHTEGRRDDERGHNKGRVTQHDPYSSYASDEQTCDADGRSRRTNEGNGQHDLYQPRTKQGTQSSPSACIKSTSRKSPAVPNNVSVKSSERPRMVDQGSGLWMLDYTGDEQNLTFGSLHKYSVPKYHRYGRGKVIGVSPSLRIRLAESSAHQVSLERPVRNSERRPRLLTSKAARMSSEPELSFPALITEEAAAADLHNEFMSSTSENHQRTNQPTLEVGGGFEDAVDYRSLKVEAFETDEPLRGTIHHKSTLGRRQDIELAAQKCNGLLIKETKENPADFTIWKRLADHQINLSFPGRSLESLGAIERHRLDEVRSSIYEKALRLTPVSTPGREAFILLYLQLATLLEDEYKAQLLWNEALANYPDSLTLTFAFVGYLQTRSTTDFESIKSAYQQAFATLHQESERATISIPGQQIHLLLRFTTFLRDACYDELAVALWQCLLDLHSNTRSQRKPDNEGRLLARMKDWWEVDIARLGEPGALPFVQWLETAGSHGSTERTSCSAKTPMIALHNSSEWLEEEWKLQANMHLPAASDEQSAADPHRHVLWDDLRPSISCLLSLLPLSQLLSAWLLHLGLPPLTVDFGPSIEELVQWQADDILHTPTIIADSSGPDWFKFHQLPLRRTIGTSQLLFDPTSFGALGKCKPPKADRHIESLPRYVQRTLHTLVDAVRTDAGTYTLIAEYLIAFTAHTFPNEVAKVSKKLIKELPESVKLYNAYALSFTISKDTSGLRKAREIWIASLSKANDFNRNAPIWRDWAWTEFRSGNEFMSLSVLQNSSLVNPSLQNEVSDICTTSPNQRLRVTQFLRDAFERNLNSHDYATAVACADMIALFNYMAEDTNISAALGTVQTQMRHLEGDSEAFGASECLLQALAELIKAHLGRARHFQLGLLLEFATGALAKHPHNSILLDLHYRLLHQDRLNDRLRLEASSVAINIDSANEVVWSHKIAEETRRWQLQPPSATTSSIRALFQNALCISRSTARHSAHLWRSWLRFELSLGQEADGPSTSRTEVSTAETIRAVLYKGLRALPWNKKWLIDSLHEINTSRRELLGHEDILQAVDMILNKGLRIRAHKVTFPSYKT